jgi:transposase
MTKKYSKDFKIIAIKLYLKLHSIRKVSKLIDCSKSSIQRWIEKYFKNENFNKHYKDRDSKITDEILDFIKLNIKNNPTITLSKIKKLIYKKFNIKISISYLYYIIKYKLKLTHKQLRTKYYPLKKLLSLQLDKYKYYKELNKYGIDNIISIDETGFYLNMRKSKGRCLKGKRCYKTVYVYPFVKFNFICAIKNGKIIGYKLYKEKGGINAIIFNNFYNDFIKNKYKNYLIILDNANFHKSEIVKNNILSSENKIIYTIAYNPNLNPIENLFSQIKNYIKNKSPDNYEQLKRDIDYIITNKIKKEHLKNYFKYLFTQANDFINKYSI